MGVVIVPSELAALEFEESSGVWVELPGVSSYVVNASPAPKREVPTWKGVANQVGHSRVPTLEFEVPGYVPHHNAWVAMRDAMLDKSLQRFRITLAKLTLGSFTGSLAVAAKGSNNTSLATLTAAADTTKPDLSEEQFGPGQAFILGSKTYVIQSIESDATAKVQGIASALSSTAVFEVAIPQLRRGPFSARISATDRDNLASEADLASGLTLEPLAELPAWAVTPALAA